MCRLYKVMLIKVADWTSFGKILLTRLTTCSPYNILHSKPNSRSQDAIISKVSIIVTTKYELESMMLHTKFHRNRPTGSRKEDFSSTYMYMGMAAILVM